MKACAVVSGITHESDTFWLQVKIAVDNGLTMDGTVQLDVPDAAAATVNAVIRAGVRQQILDVEGPDIAVGDITLFGARDES